MKKIFSLILLGIIFLFFAGPANADHDQYISILFFETDIREAINELILETGINIIVDEAVCGTVTLDLNNTPFEKALEMILLGGGYTFRKIEDYYLVGSPDSRTSSFIEMAETEVLRVNYLEAREIFDLMPSFYREFMSYTSNNNTIIITAPRRIIDRFKTDLKRLDVPPRQVKIQVLAMEISQGLIKELGVNLLEYSTIGHQAYDILGAPDLWTFFLDTNIYPLILENIKAFEDAQKASITADPWVIVADRETVNLFVGERQHIILEPVGAPARIERVDVGVALRITPFIIDNEILKLEVAPEVSHIKGEGVGGMAVRRSELVTTIYTKSGQSLVIAGMTIDEQEDRYQRVPLIGRIPLIRWLFGHKTEKVEARELLIFITPEVF